MRLFEGGILSKITEEEYQKLNDKLMGSEKFDSTSVVIEPVLEGSEPRQEDDDKQLTIAMSMKTLQGAFYVLAIGSILAGSRLVPQNIYYNNICYHIFPRFPRGIKWWLHPRDTTIDYFFFFRVFAVNRDEVTR